MMIRLADYLIGLIEGEGIKDVFTVSGGGSIALCDAVAKSKKLEYYCCHHEQAVAIAAEAYARQSQFLGVSLVTTGPGGTNSITGTCCAWIDSVPTLTISGQVYLDQTIGNTGLRQLGVQEINIVDLVKPITKYAVQITDVRDIRYHFQKAIYLATTNRPGPVWIDVPANIQMATINASEITRDFDPTEVQIQIDQDFDNKVDQTVDLLKRAKRPLLLAGHGVRISQSSEIFLNIAERHQIPIMTTWNGDDCVPSDHELFAGRPGTFASRSANFCIQNCDLLVTIGSRLPFPVTGYRSTEFARNARIVMVDIDQAELEKSSLRNFINIKSDAKLFLTSLNEVLSKERFEAPSSWIDQIRHWHLRYPVILPEYKDQKDSVNSYYFIELLGKILTNDDVIVTDMGLSFVGTHMAFSLKRGQRLFTNSGFAPMGWGLPAAVGACVANNKKRVICLTGEGGLMMNIQELSTVMHHKMPIKVFIYNNGGYLTIKQTQQLGYDKLMGSTEESGISFPDFHQIASAHGIPFLRISKHDNMEQLVQNFIQTSEFGICELVLDEDQPQQPKAINRRFPDGTTEPTSLEDMYPFLDKTEVADNLLEPLVWEK